MVAPWRHQDAGAIGGWKDHAEEHPLRILLRSTPPPPRAPVRDLCSQTPLPPTAPRGGYRELERRALHALELHCSLLPSLLDPHRAACGGRVIDPKGGS